MKIVNIANRHEMQKGKIYFYLVKELGIIKFKIDKIGRASFSNRDSILDIVITDVKLLHTEDYYNLFMKERVRKTLSLYLGINIRADLGIKKQLKSGFKNRKVALSTFRNFLVTFTAGNNSLSMPFQLVNTLNVNAVRELEGFKFFKDSKFRTFGNVKTEGDLYLNDINLSDSISNLNVRNYSVTKNGMDGYTIKSKYVDFSMNFSNHINCCGFMYLRINGIMIESGIGVMSETVKKATVEIINHVFLIALLHNRSLVLDLHTPYSSSGRDLPTAFTVMSGHIEKLPNATKINNKFLISL